MTQDSTRPDAGPVAETKAAVMDLVRGFQDFQQKVETKLRTQDDRIAMLDRKSAGRPELAQAAEPATPHRKALSA